MWTILETAAKDPTAGEIVCVLDALDEYDQNELPFLTEKIEKFLKDSQYNKMAHLKFLVTS